MCIGIRFIYLHYEFVVSDARLKPPISIRSQQVICVKTLEGPLEIVL